VPGCATRQARVAAIPSAYDWLGSCSIAGVHKSSIAVCLVALGFAATATADAAPLPALPIAGTAGTPIMPPTVVAPIKLPVLVNADAPIPANGSLLLDTRGATASPMIWLEESSGRIDGTIRALDSFIVWTPSRTLTPGTLYTLVVALPATGARTTYPVDVAPQIDPSRPQMSASFRLERVDSMNKPKCCANIPGFPVRASTCFATETTSMVRLRGSLSSTAAPTQLTQFMFRLKRANDTNVTGNVGFTPLSGIQPLLWPEPADEYCAELSALDIGSARVFLYDDLDMPCPSADDLGDLSPQPIPLDAARVLSHTICSVPPPDFDDEWCDTNQAECKGSPQTAGCENWDHLCQGGPAPVAFTGKPPSTNPVPAMPVDSPKPRRTDTRQDAGFGCSIQQRGATSSPLAALSCGLVWLSLAARRRSTRRS
jgi:hypothetical protein